MRTIYKYPFHVGGDASVSMPVGAKVLHVGRDVRFDEGLGYACIWALVETNSPMKDFDIWVVGTGHYLHDDDDAEFEAKNHVGTWQDRGLVWHLFMQRDD